MQDKSKAFELLSRRKQILRKAMSLSDEKEKKALEEEAEDLLKQSEGEGGLTLDEVYTLTLY